jgi:CRP-like cAMP-binding protein
MAISSAASFAPIRRGPGEKIFSEGEPGRTLFVVHEGRVRLVKAAAGEPARTLAILEKGDFFGEGSVFDESPRGHSAEAVDETSLIELDGAALQKAVAANAEIAIRMIRVLSSRLRDAERVAEPLPERPAPQPVPVPVPHAAPPSPVDSLLDSLRPAPVRAEASGPMLISEAGNGSFTLSGAESLIGRYDPLTDTQPEVDLAALDTRRSVSRRHARIAAVNGNYFITEEAGAINGTFVNGARLATGRPVPLKDGDAIGIGGVGLIFRL